MESGSLSIFHVRSLTTSDSSLAIPVRAINECLLHHRIILGTISFPFVAPLLHRAQLMLLRTFPKRRSVGRFGHNGWNSYAIADPVGVGQKGDYDPMRTIGSDEADGSLMIFGRTVFEDNSTGANHASLVRARFDLFFDSAFE